MCRTCSTGTKASLWVVFFSPDYAHPSRVMQLCNQILLSLTSCKWAETHTEIIKDNPLLLGTICRSVNRPAGPAHISCWWNSPLCAQTAFKHTSQRSLQRCFISSQGPAKNLCDTELSSTFPNEDCQFWVSSNQTSVINPCGICVAEWFSAHRHQPHPNDHFIS